MQISSEQCRAARGLLGWSQTELATNSSVSRATIADFENHGRWPTDANTRMLGHTMYAAGVEFLDDSEGAGVGVRFRTQRIQYTKQVKFDHSHEVATMSMRFGGRSIICRITFEAIHDLENANTMNEQQMLASVTSHLPLILNMTEHLASVAPEKNEVTLTSEMFSDH